VISRTTRQFWKHFDALPQDVQRQAVRAYSQWRITPAHPGLQFKCVSERHQVFSVRIGIRWRALGYREAGNGEDIVTWFWIGSHADYDRLIAET
jgi:hypothetical protein